MDRWLRQIGTFMTLLRRVHVRASTRVFCRSCSAFLLSLVSTVRHVSPTAEKKHPLNMARGKFEKTDLRPLAHLHGLREIDLEQAHRTLNAQCAAVFAPPDEGHLERKRTRYCYSTSRYNYVRGSREREARFRIKRKETGGASSVSRGKR